MSTPPMRMSRSLFGLDTAAVDDAVRLLTAAHASMVQSADRSLKQELQRQAQIRALLADIATLNQAHEAAAAEVAEAIKEADEASAELQRAISRHTAELDAEAAERRKSGEARIHVLVHRVARAIGQVELSAARVAGLAAGSGRIPPLAPLPPAEPERHAESPLQQQPAPSRRVLPFRTAAGSVAPAVVESPVRPASPSSSPAAATWRPGVVAKASEQTESPEPAPEAATEPADVHSDEQVAAGLKQRVAANMVRSLVGKVVGLDLCDADGELIAARGTPITPELAGRADSAGVLVELILHMAWPEEA